MSEITAYKSSEAFKYFEEICKIPHGSGNEKAIADYIVDFAKKRGLYVYRDTYNNVFIRKNAHPLCEDKPAILLQGHTDMVCEKNADTDFDFSKEPLRLEEKDGYLYAKGTTLGADDGVAVALMLAFLDDLTLKAPMLECLFTTGEETALIGASNFDYSQISARRMINLDTECEGEAVAGSAGGVRCVLGAKPEYSEGKHGEALEICVGGLKGGHSGTDIHLGRMSATVLASRLLKLICDKVLLVNFAGGNMDNAIARECKFTVYTQHKDAVTATVKDYAASLSSKAVKEDLGYSIEICKSESEDLAYTDDFKNRFTELAGEIFHGVCAMSRDLEGLVESSSNFACVKTVDDKLAITVSMRSSVEAMLDAMIEKLSMSAEKYGFNIALSGRYPGWEYDPKSKMAELFKQCYKEMSGRDGKVTLIHAGLECGLVKSNISDMDIVSIGPTIHDIHTPNERLDIMSFLAFERLVRAMLEK